MSFDKWREDSKILDKIRALGDDPNMNHLLKELDKKLQNMDSKYQQKLSPEKKPITLEEAIRNTERIQIEIKENIEEE